jgi:centromere/kinetochore protein ZW10
MEEADRGIQTEIRKISHDCAPDVDSWIMHAKSIQEDIERSKRLASSIVRQAEADDETEESLQDKESYVEFLAKEVSFNDQLLSALKGIQSVNERLRQAEDLAAQQNILESLVELEGDITFHALQCFMLTAVAAWTAIVDIPLEKTTRAMRLLDTKFFDLRRIIYDQFTQVWKALIKVDLDHNNITINKQLPSLSTSCSRW